MIGIDIGGTFTDLVAINPADGARLTRKVLTTPREPLVGVLSALKAFEETAGVAGDRMAAVIHATTLATNTLLERNGARAAMLTTRGFRDIIETGREDRYDLFDLQIDVQPPLISRDRRLGVSERVGANGKVIRELDIADLERAVQGLPGDIEAVAICFLHSYSNPAHENRAAEVVRRLRPSVYVSVSSEVAPIIREYERFIATAINTYVGPRVGAYLAELTDALTARGFSGFTGIMKSDGGMCSPLEASRLPARILESGPAAGVLSAAHTARQCGERLAVAFDMGGTTAKACLITDGHPVITDEIEVARLARFTKHSGLPLRLPGLDLIEIGAGGGSIASIGELGLLQVGPQSAGSDPGPACYGRGGDQPTVTDMDLLLGYLNPHYFAGGTLTLDRNAAEKAVRNRILSRTGTEDVTAAAWGINDIVNENMAREIRLHCVEHGIDPASVSLIATGGAGPVHAAHVMGKFGARRLICPPDVGVASAVGLLLAPRSVEKTVTHVALLEDVGIDGIRQRLALLQRELKGSVADLGSSLEAGYVLQMRLQGQAYELRVDLPAGFSIDDVVEGFVKEHLQRFGRPPPKAPIEIVNWGVTLTEPVHVPAMTSVKASSSSDRPSREAYFGPRHGWLKTPVLARSAIGSKDSLRGPLLIEDEGSTIVLTPGQTGRQDQWGNLIIEEGE